MGWGPERSKAQGMRASSGLARAVVWQGSAACFQDQAFAAWRPLLLPLTLSLQRSILVSTLTCGSSSCTMADSAAMHPAMNLGISATNWESMQYTCAPGVGNLVIWWGCAL